MNARKRIILLCFLAWVASAQAFADDSVVGIWSQVSRTKGGLGSQWVFTKEGTCTYTFGALVDFKYEIQGNRLKMTLLQSGVNEVSTEEILIDGDALTVNPKIPARKQIMKRAGKSSEGTPPIVGDWTYTHYTGGLALMRYSRTGIVQLAVPTLSVKGIYRLDQNSIVIELQGQKPISSKFKRTNNSLVLTDNENRESNFIRFDY